MVYCIDPTVEEPIMLINKHIGFDDKEGQGIDGSLFQMELLQLDALGKKRIQVWINSPGGIVMDGYNIYNAILKSKTKVDTYCVGIAASIAAVIFQAGRNRIMSDYGALMYHNPYGGTSKELDVMKGSLATMIASRSGKTEDEILAVMNRTTWIPAKGDDGALKLGFCDSIEESSDHNKKRVATAPPGEPMAMYRVANSILKEEFSKIKFPLKMKKVTNKLGLNEDASEDSILAGIATIENSLNAANSASAQAKKDLAEKEKEVADLKKKVADAEAKEKDAADAKAKAEAGEMEEKAKNMLDGFVTSGKIKAEAVDSWKESVKALGIDKVKAQLEALPVSKIANKIDVTEVAGEKKLTNVVAMAMAEARNKLKL